jgi:hypothetical protein
MVSSSVPRPARYTGTAPGEYGLGSTVLRIESYRSGVTIRTDTRTRTYSGMTNATLSGYTSPE